MELSIKCWSKAWLFKLHWAGTVHMLEDGGKENTGKKMGRKAYCPKEGLNRGAWTSHEDKLLSDYIMAHGQGRWQSLPANAGLNRCGKSCRLRWLNYLRPDIKRGNITEEEEDLIIRLHKLLGNRWSLIAGRLPGRTDNEIKNYWNTYLRKKVSGNSSEQQFLPRSKKITFQKSNPGKKESSEVNVTRTRAVRCTKALLADQVPKHAKNNFPYGFRSSVTFNHDFLPDFIENGVATLPSKKDVHGPDGTEGIMQNLLFRQAAKDGSYTSNNSFHDTGNVTSATNANGIEGIYSGEIEEGDGLYHFLDNDIWDSLLLPPKI